MKVVLAVFFLVCPSISFAGGCWNPNTHRWEWCPENPYSGSSGNLYSEGAKLSQSASQEASDLGWQRLERERLTVEAGIAASEQLGRDRRSLYRRRHLTDKE